MTAAQRKMPTKQRLEREALVLETIDQMRKYENSNAGAFLEKAVLDTELGFLEIATELADLDAVAPME